MDLRSRNILLTLVITVFLLSGEARSQTGTVESDQKVARTALQKAVSFFHETVSTRGGYVWNYSSDLSKREGEGVVTTDTIWVQPPGTPEVGIAILKAYRLTNEPKLLIAAIDAGMALIDGQMKSGGWMHRIDFESSLRPRLAYRVDKEVSRKARNYSTFDDDSTQSALRFLMLLDKTLMDAGNSNTKLHEAVEYGLDSVLKAQYPNGGWPQVYSDKPSPRQFTKSKASFPEEWSKTPDNKEYWYDITLNDGAMLDVIEMMFYAYDIYGKEEYRISAIAGANFLLAAQLPTPQPAWAQQYNAQMHPSWARKFEPPGVSAGESQSVIRTLMFAYKATGDRKYLKPIPAALDYLKKSELPNGKLARFYEMKTNRPMYMNRKQVKGKWNYFITYSDEDLPDHYGFIIDSDVDSLNNRYEKIIADTNPKPFSLWDAKPPKLTSSLQKKAMSFARSMDNRGAWVEKGELRFHPKVGHPIDVISSRTFSKNIVTIAEFIAAKP